MKRYRASITAADTEDSKLSEMIDQLKDDFDYALAGFDKLDRTGATESNQGLIIAEQLSDAIQSAIAQISDTISEVAE